MDEQISSNSQTEMSEENFLRWEAHEYFHMEKTADWYWAVGIISVSIASVAIILNNVIFGILVILGAFTLSVFASKRPDLAQIELNEKGIILHKYYYLYSSLESFWVEENDNHPKILIKSQKTFLPLIIIPLGEANSQEVRNFLLNHLKEKEYMEPLLTKFMEYLGF
ncbi:MAG: hypothetical protein HQ402_00225 [Parcubacteria group bacterium]|nr:hypothetical protein [Parcubacteria group bacterium]